MSDQEIKQLRDLLKKANSEFSSVFKTESLTTMSDDIREIDDLIYNLGKKLDEQTAELLNQ